MAAGVIAARVIRLVVSLTCGRCGFVGIPRALRPQDEPGLTHVSSSLHDRVAHARANGVLVTAGTLTTREVEMRRRGMSLLVAVLLVAVFATTAVAQSSNYTAHLTGSAEAPPVATRAVGQTIFQLNRDGTELRFRLIAANIQNITQAHIHCGAAGVNGPVVAFLYPESPPAELIPGRFSGVLATGSLTSGSVIPRPDSEACPGGVANFDELIAKIDAGGAYVNVHTAQNPAGEIRGQIR